MDLTSYVDTLRRELAAAAETGGDDARELGERLAGALDAAARLTLLEALSAAADEITRDLAPGSVEVRLRGRDPQFVVTPPPAEAPAGEPEPAPPSAPSPPLPPVAVEGEEGGVARITLRLPGQLKAGIDAAADRAGLSANAWLVRVVSAALQADDQAGPGPRPKPRPGPGRDASFGRRYQGWVR
jgi:hypothetical protein